MAGAANNGGPPFPTEWVREVPEKGSAKAVLMALTLRANAKTGRAWPGLDRLAFESGVSRAGVIRALKRLESEGWIFRERRKRDTGASTSNLYTLRLDRTDHMGGVMMRPPRSQGEIPGVSQ